MAATIGVELDASGLMMLRGPPDTELQDPGYKKERDKTNTVCVCCYWTIETCNFRLRFSADERLSSHLLRIAEDGVTKKAMPAV